jgi:hypothetical protein
MGSGTKPAAVQLARTRWEYGTLVGWRERPPLVSSGVDGVMVYGSPPWDWPWRARWSYDGKDVDYESTENRRLLNELGAEGWEVYHVEVDRISFRTANISFLGPGKGIGLEAHQTADVSWTYLMKRPVD